MRNAEEEALRANIESLGDQLEQLSEAQDEEPELEAPELDPADILAKLEAGEEPLEDAEVEALEAFTEGAGDLVDQVIDRVRSGEEISAEELELLRAAVAGEPGEGEEVAAGEAVAKAIIERSLEGLPREAAVPMLAGLGQLNRGGGLVRKRFASWADARADESQDAGLAGLFGAGDSRVARDLPASLQPEDEEDEDVLARAVAKMQAGEPLTEEELAEAAAANLRGQPFAPLAGMTLSGVAHKALVPFNRTRPVESLQETALEVRRMIAGEREDIVLGRQGRGGKRKELVRKSLGAAVAVLLGQRQ